MRLNPVDAPLGRPLSMSLGLSRESSTPVGAERADGAEKASALAAEFARARAEGYSAGMDDAAHELEERKAALNLQATKLREELKTLQEEARQHSTEALVGLDKAITQAAQLVEPAALELAILILDKVLGQRIDNASLVKEVMHAAAGVSSVPPLIFRVGKGLAEHCSEAMPSAVVDSSLGAFECVVESTKGGTCVSPARRLRAIIEPLLARLEMRGV